MAHPTPGVGPRQVVVVNQHGDNRGDEAAMTALFDGVASRPGDVQFTVVHQFTERDSEVDGGHDVTWVPMRHNAATMVRSVAALVLVNAGLPWKWVADRATSQAIDAVSNADLVLSAPGGPYFGDLYAGHEPVHWLYARLGRVFDKPTMLYAPSAGPFRRRLWNVGRRWVFRGFDVVAVREHVSAGHVRDLMGPGFAVHTTTDSALQHTPAAAADGDPTEAVTRPKVAVSVIELDGDRNYDDAVVASLATLATTVIGESDMSTGLDVVFLPQLHGRKSDHGYLSGLAEQLRLQVPDSVDVSVLDPDADSFDHRRCVATSDLVLAGRYHPAVFALGAGVPVVCVSYQHKAAGVMTDAGFGDQVINASDVTTDTLRALMLDTWGRRHELRRRMKATAVDRQQTASVTTDLAVSLLACGDSGSGDANNA